MGSHRVSQKKIREGPLRHMLPILGSPLCGTPYTNKGSAPMATLYTKAPPPPTHHNDAILDHENQQLKLHCLQLASIISLPPLVQRKDMKAHSITYTTKEKPNPCDEL